MCGLAAFVFGAALFARTTANRPLRDIAHLGAPVQGEANAGPDYYSVKLESANDAGNSGALPLNRSS